MSAPEYSIGGFRRLECGLVIAEVSGPSVDETLPRLAETDLFSMDSELYSGLTPDERRGYSSHARLVPEVRILAQAVYLANSALRFMQFTRNAVAGVASDRPTVPQLESAAEWLTEGSDDGRYLLVNSARID